MVVPQEQTEQAEPSLWDHTNLTFSADPRHASLRPLLNAVASYPLADPAHEVRRDLLAVDLVEQLMARPGIQAQGHVSHTRTPQIGSHLAHAPPHATDGILVT